MTLDDCDKLCIHNVIMRRNTKKAVQRDTLKNIIDKSKWNLKNVQVTHRKAGQNKKQKNKNKKNKN